MTGYFSRRLPFLLCLFKKIPCTVPAAAAAGTAVTGTGGDEQRRQRGVLRAEVVRRLADAHAAARRAARRLPHGGAPHAATRPPPERGEPRPRGTTGDNGGQRGTTGDHGGPWEPWEPAGTLEASEE